jgi:hypothetical protein
VQKGTTGLELEFDASLISSEQLIINLTNIYLMIENNNNEKVSAGCEYKNYRYKRCEKSKR